MVVVIQYCSILVGNGFGQIINVFIIYSIIKNTHTSQQVIYMYLQSMFCQLCHLASVLVSGVCVVHFNHIGDSLCCSAKHFRCGGDASIAWVLELPGGGAPLLQEVVSED